MTQIKDEISKIQYIQKFSTIHSAMNHTMKFKPSKLKMLQRSLIWVKAYFERRKSSIEGPLTPKLAMTDFKRAFLGTFKAIFS